MSTFRVAVVEVSEVLPHGNADALEIAHVEGSLYQVVVKKGTCKPGDLALYVPVDAVVPEEVSDGWGVTKYLSRGRVRAARLRGEVSYGFLVDAPGAAKGDDFAEAFGITHYEPPISQTGGAFEPAPGEFIEYTDIESLRAYPDALRPGEPVIVTEKRHGTNARVGFIPVDGELTLMVGSRSNRWKLGSGSVYDVPLTVPGVRELAESHPNCILFGEVFGHNLQGGGFAYGSPDSPLFEAFDLMVGGDYLDFAEFRGECARFGVPVVPVLYEGPFDLETVQALANGRSATAPDTVREGVVIKPRHERRDFEQGRVVLKLHGDDYLLSKHS